MLGATLLILFNYFDQGNCTALHAMIVDARWNLYKVYFLVDIGDYKRFLPNSVVVHGGLIFILSSDRMFEITNLS